MRVFAIISLSLLLSGSALAQSQNTDIRPDAKRVVGDKLLKEFLGVTHDGAYNFTDDGEPQRFYRETHHKNSQTSYVEDEQTMLGVWTIMRDQLCFEYPGDRMSGGCFRVYKVGNCFYYYSNQIPESSMEIDRDYWTARSVKEGQIPNCEPAVS